MREGGNISADGIFIENRSVLSQSGKEPNIKDVLFVHVPPDIQGKNQDDVGEK